MNQKGFANIVLVIVIIILAGMVGYFMLIKKSEPIAQKPTPTNQAANLKTYTNQSMGFEMKYPSTWSVSQQKDLSDNLAIQFISPGFSEGNFSVFLVSRYQDSKPTGSAITLPNGMSGVKSEGRSDRGVSEQDIFVEHAGYIYVLNYQVHKKIVGKYTVPVQFTVGEETLRNQILATFKFTN